VNIADLLSYWTGGLLKSTVHRVVFSSGSEENGRNSADGRPDEVKSNDGEIGVHGNRNGHPQARDGNVDGNGYRNGNGHGSGDRYSIAFFLHPNRDTPLVPIPSPLLQTPGETTGKVLTANEHLKSRLAATYGWGKEDVEARRELDAGV